MFRARHTVAVYGAGPDVPIECAMRKGQVGERFRSTIFSVVRHDNSWKFAQDGVAIIDGMLEGHLGTVELGLLGIDDYDTARFPVNESLLEGIRAALLAPTRRGELRRGNRCMGSRGDG